MSETYHKVIRPDGHGRPDGAEGGAGMSALEWLDAVRADLRRATPGPWRTEWDDADRWHSITGTGHSLGGGLWVVCPAVATVEAGGDADATLIASAPDHLDRMERALRDVLEMRPDLVCWDAEDRGYERGLNDVWTAIEEALSDE